MAEDVTGPRRGGGFQKRKPNPRVRWTPKVEAAFLAELVRTCNVRASARAAGVRPSIPYQHKATSPAFSTAWDAAISEAYSTLQAAAIDRGINGVRKPIFYQGKRVGSAIEYSDQLVLQLLRMHQETATRVAIATAQSEAEASKGDALARLDAKLSAMNRNMGGAG